MVVIKGVIVAVRAVTAALVLLLFIVYVFAVGMRKLMDGTETGKLYFPDVVTSTRYLLLAAWCPDLIQPFVDVWEEGIFFAFCFLLFVLIGAITIMNMLIGILVGVMNTVATVEKEEIMIDFAKRTLVDILRGEASTKIVDENFDGCISKAEFEILLEVPKAQNAFYQMGVDPEGLHDYGDFIFKTKEKLTFKDFMEMVMHLRGGNLATVKDVVDLRHFIISEMNDLHASNADATARLGGSPPTLLKKGAKQLSASSMTDRASIHPFNASESEDEDDNDKQTRDNSIGNN
jgi:hypothetical protein